MNTKKIFIFTLCVACLMIIATAGFFFRSGSKETAAQSRPDPKRNADGFSTALPPPSNSSTGNQSVQTKPNAKTAGAMPQSQPPLAPAVSQDATATNATVGQPSGSKTTARVTVAGQQQTLAVNDIGNYPKIYIDPLAKVPVSLSFPQGEAGDPVLVYATDGGQINDKVSGGKAFYLDDSKTINFQFQANRDEGIYRVVVTKGSETSVLQFWAGKETPFANR